MSPIGRVFIVLNLILAGTFVGFTGTYLQRADDFRKKFNQEVTNHEETRSSMQAQNESITQAKNKAERQLGLSESSRDKLTTDLDSAKQDNAEYDRRLAKLEIDYATVAQNTGAMATAVKVAHQTAQQAMDRAIKAEAAKDTAVAAETKAQKEIQRLNFTIRNKESDVAKLNATNKDLDQIRREQEVLLDLVRIKAPGIFATLQPSVSGRVEHVGATGKLLTIAVNAGGEFLKPGHRFAIYNRTDGYLGEALVTEWDGSKYAFATLNVTPDNARKVRTGDMASTNLSGNNTAKKGGN